jgi:hypothetical protein
MNLSIWRNAQPVTQCVPAATHPLRLSFRLGRLRRLSRDLGREPARRRSGDDRDVGGPHRASLGRRSPRPSRYQARAGDRGDRADQGCSAAAPDSAGGAGCAARYARNNRVDPVPDTMLARNRAMLLLGFGAALKRSELVGLAIDDVTAVPGAGCASWRTVPSPTSKAGAIGRGLGQPRQSPASVPQRRWRFGSCPDVKSRTCGTLTTTRLA